MKMMQANYDNHGVPDEPIIRIEESVLDADVEEVRFDSDEDAVDDDFNFDNQPFLLC